MKSVLICMTLALALVACKKDNPTRPKTVETDSEHIQCYNAIEFNEAPKSAGKAWFKTRFGEIDWSLAEGYEDYEFAVEQGGRSLLDAETRLPTETWRTLSFSLWPPTTFVGIIGETPNAAERIKMFVAAPFDYSIEKIVDEYIKVGKLELYDGRNTSKPGGWGFAFTCTCDNDGSIWYESHLGAQDGQSVECTKKNKRTENGKTYYDLAFKFSANIYSFGFERWTTFEEGVFEFTMEME
jgi:hypothetical protein